MPETPDAADPLTGWTAAPFGADVDTPGHPTNEARTQVTVFLRERLAQRG